MITAGKEVVLEGDYGDNCIASPEFILVITQLRDVRTAGESAEMSVKDQQKPMSPEFFEPVGIAVAVAEIK